MTKTKGVELLRAALGRSNAEAAYDNTQAAGLKACRRNARIARIALRQVAEDINRLLLLQEGDPRNRARENDLARIASRLIETAGG